MDPPNLVELLFFAITLSEYIALDLNCQGSGRAKAAYGVSISDDIRDRRRRRNVSSLTLA